MEDTTSRPVRALWIEIGLWLTITKLWKSRPVRALWIEIYLILQSCFCFPSRPVRALWIEMYYIILTWQRNTVEAREGLVD